jgi:hypothetical protein
MPEKRPTVYRIKPVKPEKNEEPESMDYESLLEEVLTALDEGADPKEVVTQVRDLLAKNEPAEIEEPEGPAETEGLQLTPPPGVSLIDPTVFGG